jgi:hypothetical protein
MAINPNVEFIAGSILTADQQNRLPFGVCARASSTTSYTLTTSVVIATGMTATFTAITGRLYRITYNEPQANTTTVVNGFTSTQIRQTNAAGTLLSSAILQVNVASTQINGNMQVFYVGSFTAGSVTVVGCATTSSTTGAPVLTRSATAPAQIVVEDIGPS